jgi:tripartite tricarboxylate transporter family receptor
VLAVSPAVPAKTLPEFVDHARRVSGKLNFGSAGIGSTLHVMTEIFQREAGFEAVHVPFRGSTPAVQALLRGDLDFLIDTVVIPSIWTCARTTTISAGSFAGARSGDSDHRRAAPRTSSCFAAPRICVILAAAPDHMRSTRA